jgi:hypothetical protein
LLPTLSASSCEFVIGGQHNDGRVKRSSEDDKSWPDCLVVRRCLFKDLHAAPLQFWTLGAAICLELPGSTGNEVEESTFINCYTLTPFAEDYGGAIGVWASSIKICRCCGNECRSQYGQFVWVKGASFTELSEITAIRCAKPDSVDINTGALDFAEGVGPTIWNANFTDCIATEDGTAIDLWGGSVSVCCRFLTVFGCNGPSSVYSHRPLFEASYSNFVSNSHSTAVIDCNGNTVSLSHCHFKSNSRALFKSGNAGMFIVENCHLDSRLPSDIPYSLTSNNVITGDAITLPLCHLSTIYCHRQPNCETFTFTVSVHFSISSDRSHSVLFIVPSQFPESVCSNTPLNVTNQIRLSDRLD